MKFTYASLHELCVLIRIHKNGKIQSILEYILIILLILEFNTPLLNMEYLQRLFIIFREYQSF